MKRALVPGLAALALGCYTNTNPLTSWAGTYHLTSVDSLPLPASYMVAGQPARAVERTLYVYPGGTGMWTDSSFGIYVGCDRGFNATPTTMCDTSGRAVITWTAAGDTLIVSRVFGSTLGYVVPVKTFVRQVDGALLKTDEQQYEVYRR